MSARGNGARAGDLLAPWMVRATGRGSGPGMGILQGQSHHARSRLGFEPSLLFFFFLFSGRLGLSPLGMCSAWTGSGLRVRGRGRDVAAVLFLPTTRRPFAKEGSGLFELVVIYE